MSAFEDFVNLELPKRRPLETNATVSYDNDPNLPGAPNALKLAPLGTWFREETAGKWWTKTGPGATDWEDNTPGGGGGGVTIYATETALLADTPSDGTIGYAEDTDRYFFRKAKQTPYLVAGLGFYRPEIRWDQPFKRLAIFAANVIALIRLDGSAAPRPAMSYPVP